VFLMGLLRVCKWVVNGFQRVSKEFIRVCEGFLNSFERVSKEL